MIVTSIVMFIIAVAAGVLELPSLLRKAWTKEAIVYTVMLVAGSIVSVMAIENIRPFSPMSVPEEMYKPVYEWMHHILHVKED
ncbi:hypothetical protein ACFFNY_16140 [Paenibacillus hodogayensis]|uniref:Uncharacterized protein n=1 Tax=Paenibacillus hodogayensis TaxID=279208 RepID=A0ABV5VYQ3_9BACL